MSQNVLIRLHGVACILGGMFLAAFVLLGLPGLFAQQRAVLSWVGGGGFILSFLGNAMFLGTGMITAFALVVGAILGMLPPHPVGALPWWALVLGGVLYGAALIWLGAFLWVKNTPTSAAFGGA